MTMMMRCSEQILIIDILIFLQQVVSKNRPIRVQSMNS